jgi:hypothetical protein
MNTIRLTAKAEAFMAQKQAWDAYYQACQHTSSEEFKRLCERCGAAEDEAMATRETMSAAYNLGWDRWAETGRHNATEEDMDWFARHNGGIDWTHRDVSQFREGMQDAF